MWDYAVSYRSHDRAIIGFGFCASSGTFCMQDMSCVETPGFVAIVGLLPWGSWKSCLFCLAVPFAYQTCAGLKYSWVGALCKISVQLRRPSLRILCLANAGIYLCVAWYISQAVGIRCHVSLGAAKASAEEKQLISVCNVIMYSHFSFVLALLAVGYSYVGRKSKAMVIFSFYLCI